MAFWERSELFCAAVSSVPPIEEAMLAVDDRRSRRRSS